VRSAAGGWRAAVVGAAAGAVAGAPAPTTGRGSARSSSAGGGTVWVPRTRSHHATSPYWWRRPPSRSRRSPWIVASERGDRGRAAADAAIGAGGGAWVRRAADHGRPHRTCLIGRRTPCCAAPAPTAGGPVHRRSTRCGCCPLAGPWRRSLPCAGARAATCRTARSSATRDTSIAGDLPPVLGQPDRVRAVAAADVERSAGGSSVTSATSAPLAKRLR
jgi:hypothetical protein